MTEQYKQLLLIDLCGRLPYRVVINMDGQFDNIPSAIDIISGEVWDTMHENAYPIGQYEIKPYLRPMSSMTEEEKKKFYDICTTLSEDKNHFIMEGFIDSNYMLEKFDWLNAHHFDYRGLIEKGLALEATEGMYNNKTE